jgi:hypothetical protein
LPAPPIERTNSTEEHHHHGADGGGVITRVFSSEEAEEAEEELLERNVHQPAAGKLARRDPGLVQVVVPWWDQQDDVRPGLLVDCLENPAKYGFTRDAEGRWRPRSPPRPTGKQFGSTITSWLKQRSANNERP